MNFAIKVVQPSDFSSVDAIAQFQTEIEHVLQSGADIILVDLKQITSITSASFIVLVKGLKALLAPERQLVICSMNEQVRILFELTGLDEVFKLFADRDEAHQYLQPSNKVEVLKSKSEAPKAKPSVSTLKLAG